MNPVWFDPRGFEGTIARVFGKVHLPPQTLKLPISSAGQSLLDNHSSNITLVFTISYHLSRISNRLV